MRTRTGTWLVAVLLYCQAVGGRALAQGAVLSAAAFDVASVRPSKPDAEQHSNVPLDSGNVYAPVSADDARTAAGGLLVATHQPLWRYISFAYSLSGTQELSLRFSMFSGAPKSGAPTWVTGTFTGGAEPFDISARAPADTSVEQMRAMMRSLLADRFHLRTAWVTADTPVFALSSVRHGASSPKLQPHAVADTCTGNTTAPPSRPGALSPEELPPACGVIARVPSTLAGGQRYGGRAVPLSLLATSVPTMTGLAVTPRPVVDQTGLTGLYDFSLTWVHDAAGGDAAISENAANFREALKQQLGLDLKPARAAIPFLTITSVERPSAN